MTFGWVLAAMGSDRGLAKTVKVGDRVEHRGTKQWGKVLEVKPQPDDTAELRVDREVGGPFDAKGEGWWASYQTRGHEAC